MRHRTTYILVITFLLGRSLWAQSIDDPLRKYNSETVPYIYVDELHKKLKDYALLDTRKKEEYAVSHLPGAIWVGEKFDDKHIQQQYPDKNTPIVVYCSIGVRSEDFGERLQKAGYLQVKNLYGSLFAWKNKNYALENANGNPTDSVHVYSEDWSVYLKKGIKVYH